MDFRSFGFDGGHSSGRGCGESRGFSLGDLFGGGRDDFGSMCGYDNGMMNGSFGMGGFDVRNMLDNFSICDNNGLGNTLGRVLGVVGSALLQGALNRFAYGNMDDLCSSCRHLDPYMGNGFGFNNPYNPYDNHCQSDYMSNVPYGYMNRVPRLNGLQRLMRHI